MKKVLGSIVFVIYAIIAITVTLLLLTYNEYNCSEIGGYTVYIVNDDSLEPEYKQGSILLIKHTSDKNLKENDGMFLYKVLNSQEYEVVNKTLQSKTQQGRHITYVTTDDENYASDYLIGKESDTIVINGWGYALSLLESKWGYLFCIVIVSLLLFLQEAFELAMELKYGEGSKKKQAAQAVQTETATKVQVAKTESKPATKKPVAKTESKPATKKTTTQAKAKTTTKKVVKTNDANQSDVKEG